MEEESYEMEQLGKRLKAKTTVKIDANERNEYRP